MINDNIYDDDKEKEKDKGEKPDIPTSKALKFSLSDWFKKDLSSIAILIFTVFWFLAIPNIATWLIPKLKGTPWCLLVMAIFYPLVIAVIKNLFFENMEKGKRGNAVMLITVIMIIIPLLQAATDHKEDPRNSEVVINWWGDEVSLEKNSQIVIGEVKADDQLRSWSVNGHIILRDGYAPNQIRGGIDMTTTFENFIGNKTIKLSGNGKMDTIVRYRIIRR